MFQILSPFFYYGKFSFGYEWKFHSRDSTCNNSYIYFVSAQKNISKVQYMISVIKLAEHSHTTLDPVLRGSAGGQHHGDNKVGGVACGREGALPLTGLVKRTNVQYLRLVAALPLTCVGEKEAKNTWKIVTMET